MRSLYVALVATLPDGDESLGLAYLSTALRQAGHRPRVVTFRGHHDLEEAAGRVCALPAALLGIAIPSGHAAIDVLALLHRVRQMGFNGHVTCGGAYATLARSRLLKDYPGLDSVVRHDGELPIAALANAIASGEPLSNVPGLTTRQGDGAPAPVDDASGMSMIPEREPSRLYAGVASAKLSAVRGCWGGCRYCGLAGLRREASHEARLRGLSRDKARRAGIGGMRRRPIEHVANEMAKLYRECDVRYFHFVDENHLPRDPKQACAVLSDLTDALERRGVRQRALSLMLRADIATREVTDALARLGVVRCLLGVESNTQQGLAALGRGAALETNRVAVDNLNRHNVSFHLNLLLIHPDSTLASIEQEVSALAGLEGGLVDPFQVEALEGTDLFAGLERSGRLLGGPHLWHFWPSEPAARRFAELFFVLKREVMGRQQLTAYAYEVLGTLAVAGKLGRLGAAHHRLLSEGRGLILEHNQLWRRLLQTSIELARCPDQRLEKSFLKQGSVQAAAATLDFAKLARAVRAAANAPLRTDVHYPRTLSAVAFAASVLAACGGSTSQEPASPHDASVLDGGNVDAGSDASVNDGASEAAADAPVDTALDAVCGTETAHAELTEVLSATWSCGDICSDPPGMDFSYQFLLDAAGHVVDMERDDGEPIPDELKQCYLAAVAGQVFPCLAEHAIWVPCNIALK
jgi:radical SAM superfamily enzyme YgiQ (UPF0313 family)